MDAGNLDGFMARYQRVRRVADESKHLVVSSNFERKYTFDEVDVTLVIKDLLMEGEPKADESNEKEEREEESEEKASS